MDHFPRYLSTVLLCLAISTVLAFGQNDWDAVLERYESISRQCLELRARVTAGEAVADRSVAGLLQEMARLKSTLQDASGTMTPAQRRRFTRIRDSYAKAVGAPAAGEARATPPRKEVRPPVLKEEAPKKEEIIRPELVPLPQLQSPASPGLFAGSPSQALHRIPLRHAPLRQLSQDPVGKSATGSALHGCFLASSVLPFTESYGAYGVIVALSGRHLGAYVAGRSSFSSLKTSYKCSGDGAIEGVGRFWGDGRTDFSAWSVTGGPLVRLRESLSFYLGGGLGSRQRVWHDIKGEWALVTDQSFRGLTLESGAIVSWHHVSLSAGIICLLPSRRIAATLGLGYSF